MVQFITDEIIISFQRSTFRSFHKFDPDPDPAATASTPEQPSELSCFFPLFSSIPTSVRL